MGLILPLKTVIPAMEMRRDCSTAVVSEAATAMAMPEFSVPLKQVIRLNNTA